MAGIGSALLTSTGFPRNRQWFWLEMLESRRELFSAHNQDLIEHGRSPVVDRHWLKEYPMHAGFIGDTIVHHHIGEGVHATPLPMSVHRRWHYEQRLKREGGEAP